ncbi:hypothetical protein A3A95_03495 [Candidatus Nomurabacteria bacterium RIFCSPLOWO2_01_FULL_39_18]|uniref:Uncharacterized protein n=1 Tax=Candidatus Nomurabacteria bacterium RIFCSPHIGHO2_01_FULL_40_24b TaxID=1801739 RepID=A0A1F6V6N0_9BACT|nr:MAG: hypothetical protein A2647_05025 [Candidatus Nomurabacteria bacterium RIFCSPHIGHO2_01_FULL_40_24b]OGI89173.1 MAG: hypothetical protein A3A95_03495 [Candidatus Nomurabacteria bacterium RIFCSPLOWO2_01_FULL_39_18]
MSLFWNKKVESDKIIYTRTKSQKRFAYLLISIGFLLVIGLPTLIKNSVYFQELSQQFPTLFLSLIFLGFLLLFFVIISVFIVNFKFMSAKMKNKKFQITSTNEGDVVEIEK